VSKIEPGTLQCVIATGCADALLAALSERVRPGDIRRIGLEAVLVHTALEPAGLRDWLSGVLTEGESLLVVEFEKWSGFGTGVDREWLLARGH
jgi:hypothetical protein